MSYMSTYFILENKWISVEYVIVDIVVVKALCYKPERRGFETGWGEWISSVYLILPGALGPGIYSASNRNEYQKQKNVFGQWSAAGA
jgi:hypothetical protein